jgi:hypothetical protein
MIVIHNTLFLISIYDPPGICGNNHKTLNVGAGILPSGQSGRLARQPSDPGSILDRDGLYTFRCIPPAPWAFLGWIYAIYKSSYYIFIFIFAFVAFRRMAWARDRRVFTVWNNVCKALTMMKRGSLSRRTMHVWPWHSELSSVPGCQSTLIW